ncbi:TrfB-related DNA-binding protein [Ralstonia pseudosolanacearum]|nr:TrfB-related DNA-binding protein [Ralstonia pseudosolanacearum]
MPIFRLTPEQFEQLDRQMRENAGLGAPFGDKSREIAYLVIVEGYQQTVAASKHKVTRQWVHQVVKRYIEAFADLEGAGLWVTQSFELPNTLVKPLTTFLQKIKGQKNLNKIDAAVDGVIQALSAQSKRLK